MTGRPAAGSRAACAARPGLIDRHDLVAALDRAAGKQVTIISAPAGSGKTSLLQAWAERAGQQRRIAFMSVRPGQHDAQLFWLALLGAVRVATGGAEPPPAAPGFNGQAMVDKVRSELAASGGPFVLIIDDLHELSSAEAAGQLTALLTSLPPGVHAVVATRRDLPLRLHQLRLAGELAEIRAAQLRFTENETRELLSAAGLTLPDPVLAMLHQRTEGWAAGLRLAVLSLDGNPNPERFVAEFSGNDRTVAEYLMAEMLAVGLAEHRQHPYPPDLRQARRDRPVLGGAARPRTAAAVIRPRRIAPGSPDPGDAGSPDGSRPWVPWLTTPSCTSSGSTATSAPPC